MQWWCSARSESWVWTWAAYPGVWLFVALAAWLTRRVRRMGPGDLATPAPAWEAPAAWSAILLLWGALDWPVGPLGAGYLASVHAVQFILLAMIIPPLVLLGVPLGAWERLAARSGVAALLTTITDPFRMMLQFTTVMVFTHMPWVVDSLMATQLGSFALDLLWLVSGLGFFWPLISPIPSRPGFIPLLRIAYLFVGTIAHVFIGMWFLIADYPVFATYELAPPLAGLPARADQQWAGGIFLLIGSPLVLLAMTVIFFRWHGTGDEPDVAAP